MRGHLYELPENSEFIVGRGTNFDIVVEEDMVSRKHAKITTFHQDIVVQDLNSTNGTLVNQQRIEGGHRLQVGDLLTIGTCVLELISPTEVASAHQQLAAQGQQAPAPVYSQANYNAAAPPQAAFQTANLGMSPLAQGQQGGYAPQQAQPMPPQQPVMQQPAMMQPPPMMQQQAQGGGFGGGHPGMPPAQHAQPANPPAPQGNFYGAGSAGGFNSLGGMRPRSKGESGNFPSAEVPDMIVQVERLVERRHDGILVVMDQDEREGNVYFRGGRIYFASVEDPHHFSEHPMHPLQSLIRICGWTQGSFRVKSNNALPSFEGELNEESRTLMERVRQSCAELKALRAQLPPLDSRLAVPSPLNAPLAKLSEDQLNAFQMCMNHYPIQNAVDFNPLGEREGIKVLLSLLEAGYLVRM